MVFYPNDRSLLHILPAEFKDELDGLAVNRRFSKDSMIFSDGEEASNLFLIRSGKVKISKTTIDGKELTLYICLENELIGEFSLFQPEAAYTTNAEMMEDGEIGIIPTTELEKKLAGNGKLAIEFMKWMGIAYRRNQSKFRDLILHGKHGALYSTLIRMTNTYGKEVGGGILIDLSLTNQELAKFIGTTRENVNRMLNELRKNHIISHKSGYITIHNLDYLKRFIDCDDCPDEICRI